MGRFSESRLNHEKNDKTQKIYFFDTGLASHLLNIEKKEQLKSFPLTGNLYENFVIIEFLKCRFNRGLRSNLYYFRDNTGNEVDILLDFASKPYPVEIKMGKTINSDFFKGLDYIRKITGEKNKSALITGASGPQTRSGVEIFNYSSIDDVYKMLSGEAE